MYRVALVYGGFSSEHEVSLLTAKSVYKQLDPKLFEVVLVFMDKHQRFYIANQLEDLKAYVKPRFKANQEVSFITENFIHYLKYKRGFKKKIQFDIAFPLIHGLSGEDGSLQGYFELKQIPYCQSSLLSMATTLDKDVCKQLCIANAIPVVDYMKLLKNDSFELDSLDKVSYPKPWILKPARGGSSIGIQIVDKDDQQYSKLLACFSFDSKVILEPKLENIREFNLAILGDQDGILFSNVEEVMKQEEILSYNDKYLKQSKRILPARIDEDLQKEMEDIARRVFEVFECSGVIRIDFIYHDQKLYVNEVNSIPGSLAMYLFEGIIPKDELLTQCILFGFKQERIHKKMIRTFESSLLNHANEFEMKK